MALSGQKQPFTGGPNSWLREEHFLKIHLELTLLTNRAGLSWEDSEEIAGDCLSTLWEEYERTGFPYPIKPFLSARMESLIREYHQKIQLETETETSILLSNDIESKADDNYSERVSLIRDTLLPFLKTEEQAVLRPLLLNGMDLPAIAASLSYPLNKVRKHYKHSILRLQKHLGLWKKV